jgi:hypothetical protein
MKSLTPEPQFDIISGTRDKDARWLEATDGLVEARERMELIAVEKPGKYFVFSMSSDSALADPQLHSSPSSTTEYSRHL